MKHLAPSSRTHTLLIKTEAATVMWHTDVWLSQQRSASLSALFQIQIWDKIWGLKCRQRVKKLLKSRILLLTSWGY